MLASNHVKYAARLLVAALLGFGTIAAAAEPDQKAATPAKAAGPEHKAPPAKGDEPLQGLQGIVARVNGAEIREIELRRAKKIIVSGQPGLQVPPERQKEFDQQALTQLVSTELLYQAGQKLAVKDLDKRVDEKLAESKARFANKEDFAKAIKALDMDESELREYTRRDLVISNFIDQEIVARIKIGEEESRKFYDQNLDKFTRGETVRASHILFGLDPKATVEEKKQAREKAEKLRKELAGGADFAALAKANSICPSSSLGGDLGHFGKGQMVPSFEQAAFALKPGELSDVVETQFGYHIIKVTERKGAETTPFKDVRARIEEYLKGQKVSAAVNDFLAEARKGAKVEILLK